MSHDNRHQAGASARSVLVSSLVHQRSRGVPRHQAKVAISVQQDQDQADDKAEVIVEPKMAAPQSLSHAQTTFCQDSLY